MNSCALERHRLVARPSLGAVILPAEGDTTFIEGDQPPVRDRHAVGIAGQIGQHRRWSGKRAFGIDDPFQFAQRREPVGESARIGEWRALAEELQLPSVMRLQPVLRGNGVETIARARAPAGRSPACRPPNARRQATDRRRERCHARGDDGSAPIPRCAAPGSRRSAHPDAWGRRRWCSRVSAATSNNRR